MRENDKQIGCPNVLYKDTRANIEALSGVDEGAEAYATDINQFGTFNGSTWDWLNESVPIGELLVDDDGALLLDDDNDLLYEF